MMFDGLGSSAAHIKGGRIGLMMVSGAKRNPAFPDVPSAAEVGLPDYTVTTWYGVWAPKGTPAEAAGPAMIAGLQHRRRETSRSGPARAPSSPTWPARSSAVSSSAEDGKWAQVVKASGAKLD
jgi:hypothetical protein